MMFWKYDDGQDFGDNINKHKLRFYWNFNHKIPAKRITGQPQYEFIFSLFSPQDRFMNGLWLSSKI